MAKKQTTNAVKKAATSKKATTKKATAKVTPKVAPKPDRKAVVAKALATMPKGVVDMPLSTKLRITEAEKPNPMNVYFVDFWNGKQFTTQKAAEGEGVDVFKRHIKDPKKGFEYCGTASSLEDAIHGMRTGRYHRFGRG
jgi:hypothetical protein